MAENKLTPLQQVEADRKAAAAAKVNKVSRIFSDEEKATRKERVGKAKDALSRSVGMKGDHVVSGRAALKKYQPGWSGFSCRAWRESSSPRSNSPMNAK